MHRPHAFESFFQAGFECSTQRRPDGRRLDLLAATGHDRLAAEDYRAARRQGLRSVRDGLRWHRIETRPGHYDWSSFLPMLGAARDAGVQVIWDLCHYGWPEDLDVWSGAFVERFARFAAAVARVVRDESERAPWYSPVNEISFWAWAGGDQARFEPCATGRADELKRQLVRATLAAIDAIREVEPRARFVQCDPLIQVHAPPQDRAALQAAAGFTAAQFQAWDMISGRRQPELGGRPDCLDVIGLNYYPNNQWVLGGGTVELGNPAYRPLAGLLADVHRRYARPLLIAETGAEGGARAAWLHYVGDEALRALEAGVPLEGVCLYPVLDYPGWDNERHCEAGLFGAPADDGARPLHGPLAEELHRQQQRLTAICGTLSLATGS